MYRDLKLADRARIIGLAVKSGITDLRTIENVYNTFAQGGDLEESQPSSKRNYNGRPITLEEYQQLQAQAIREAAVKKALTRTAGVAPIINGEPASSCIYTFTDNYGKKYQVAGTQTFAANPEKYGFEVAGPVTEGMEGNMYMQMNEKGVPYHATMITGYADDGKPLLTYSSGHAGGFSEGLPGGPIPRDRWNNPNETYEHYLERYNRSNSPEADYHKNRKVWSSPQYETYRFIGTPEDKARWTEEWSRLEGYPSIDGIRLAPLDTPLVTVPEVAPSFAQGGRLFGGGGDEEIPSTPYTGEIRQGKKWTAWDNWKADHPMAMHRIRKAGVLLSDAAKLIPGFRVAETLMSPGTMSDYGDMVSRKYGDTVDDSAADRVSGLATPLGAAARAARPIVKTLEQVKPNTPWVTKVSTFRDKLIEADRIMNALQLVDDFAKPVGQFKEGGHKIHIKKANRGKFTALKKRTGHSASWFKAHGTPAQKKMAVFALNARKWKHGKGGYLMTKL